MDGPCSGAFPVPAIGHLTSTEVIAHLHGVPEWLEGWRKATRLIDSVTFKLGFSFAGEEEGKSLQLCYLRHAFGLGEHYNSVAALPAEEEDD